MMTQMKGETFNEMRKARMSGLKMNTESSDVRMKTDDLELNRDAKTFDVRMKAENLEIAQDAETSFLTRY